MRYNRILALSLICHTTGMGTSAKKTSVDVAKIVLPMAIFTNSRIGRHFPSFIERSQYAFNGVQWVRCNIQ